MLNAFGHRDSGSSFYQNVILVQETRPLQFYDSADRHLCRGRFSHVNPLLFGLTSSAKQRDSQQLEAPRPDHSGRHMSFTDQAIKRRNDNDTYYESI